MMLHVDLYDLMMAWLLPFSKLFLLACNLLFFGAILLVIQRQRLNARSLDKLTSVVEGVSGEDREGGEQQNEHTLRVGFVVAHPDDEAMFMVPTVIGMLSSSRNADHGASEGGNQDSEKERKRNIQIHMMCLSSGNADGIGATRIDEWRKCLRHMAVISNEHHVQVVNRVEPLRLDARAILVDNEEEFADGMRTHWDENRISQYVESFVLRYELQALFTFDGHGISQHPNHKAVHGGVMKFLGQHNAVLGYELETVSLWRKYAAFLDALLPGSTSRYDSDNYLSYIIPSDYTFHAYSAMQCHASQFVWFRKLFVAVSRYAYYNTWKRMSTSPAHDESRVKED